MRHFFYLLTTIGVALILSGCSGMKINDYQGTTPVLNLESYFNGPIKAWGILQDRSGKVTRRFDITMVGTWKDGVGTLEEDFVFYDGEKQHRTWTITKTGENTYEGRAGDIIGTATGKSAGHAMQWAYDMDLKVDGSTYRIHFDDWMFQMNDGVLINRSYLKKFGITMAELTIFMQKQ